MTERLHPTTGGTTEGTPLPSALGSLESIVARARGRRFALFLDYDGTLTPIVSRPDLATLSPAMRETLVRLAARCPVAIVSGRDLRDVQRLVGLEQLHYAGSHGFDLAGPGGLHLEHPQAGAFLGDLDRAERLLRERIGAVPGALIERKRFAIAVHYRLVSARGVSAIEAALAEVNAASPGLRRTGGKKIHELRPNLPWDKGKAVHWLLGTLGLDGPDVLALYLGDDETDEDAFAALQADGLGIVVAEPARASRAHFRLHDPSEVRNFLDRLAALELCAKRP